MDRIHNLAKARFPSHDITPLSGGAQTPFICWSETGSARFRKSRCSPTAMPQLRPNACGS